MTLLVMDGYEHRVNTARPGVLYPGSALQFVTGRYGGAAVQLNGVTTNSTYTLPTPAATVVVGHAIKWTMNATLNAVVVFSADANTTNHITCNMLTNGSIEVRRGTQTQTIIGTTAAGVLVAGQWHYIEVKVTLSDTVGVVVIRVDGTVVLNLTPIDTKNAGTALVFDTIKVSYAGTLNSQHDDLYMLDTTGSAPYNDFLGDCKIETLVPNGNGASSQFLGSDGNAVDNYALVDELPAVFTDLVGTPNAGDKDIYAFTDLVTTTGTVLAVKTSALCQKSDAGAGSMETVTRSSGTEAYGPVTALSASPGGWVPGPIYITDPTGAPWTIASVNAAQFGVRSQ